MLKPSCWKFNKASSEGRVLSWFFLCGFLFGWLGAFFCTLCIFLHRIAKLYWETIMAGVRHYCSFSRSWKVFLFGQTLPWFISRFYQSLSAYFCSYNIKPVFPLSFLHPLNIQPDEELWRSQNVAHYFVTFWMAPTGLPDWGVWIFLLLIDQHGFLSFLWAFHKGLQSWVEELWDKTALLQKMTPTCFFSPTLREKHTLEMGNLTERTEQPRCPDIPPLKVTASHCCLSLKNSQWCILPTTGMQQTHFFGVHIPSF